MKRIFQPRRSRRVSRPLVQVFLALVFLWLAPPAAAGTVFSESPMLAERVQKGELPPVEARLPEDPAVADLAGANAAPGQYGGDLHMIMGGPKDVRMMVVYGYARLVAYDTSFNLVPDILESFDVEEGRIFTFHLRKGHRWSDGEPFTSEDFRYYWEDVANNTELSPSGIPSVMMVDGEKPVFEVLDETTVRFSWSKPNPLFLPALAGPSPLYIYRPAHYLKKYHAKYADPAKLKEAVDDASLRNWAALHVKKDSQYKNDNPKLPTLEPWINTTKGPSVRFVFERNPFYYRVDTAGQQLPYLDRVILEVADSKIIPAKVGSGEADLQARYLHFDNYTFLKAAEDRNHYDVRLWRSGLGAQLALYPNLNANDPVWRETLRDVRFRRALSLAVDRHEINQVIYYGLAREGNNTLLPESPLYRDDYRTRWATLDLAKANALLDEMGLTKRDDDGFRRLPDGRTLELVVEFAGENTEEVDVLRLIGDSWAQIGVKMLPKLSEREVLRNRIFAGDTVMSIWFGLEDGVANAAASPAELVPSSQQQLEWPKWGQLVETNGRVGEPVDLPDALELQHAFEDWSVALTDQARTAAWRRILDIYTDQVYTIGTVNGVPQPVVVNRRLHNVPKDGIYNWDPGAHFGIYKPDTFWLGAPVAGAATGSTG